MNIKEIVKCSECGTPHDLNDFFENQNIVSLKERDRYGDQMYMCFECLQREEDS